MQAKNPCKKKKKIQEKSNKKQILLHSISQNMIFVKSSHPHKEITTLSAVKAYLLTYLEVQQRLFTYFTSLPRQLC